MSTGHAPTNASSKRCTCGFARFFWRDVLGAYHSAEAGLADTAVAEHNDADVI